MRGSRLILGLLIVVATFALSSSGSAHAAPAAADPPAKFRDAACPVDLPAGQLPQNVRCGYLTVPETRGGDDGRTVTLAVAILKSTSAHRQPDPVVYLTGGPGYPALNGEFQGLGQAEFAAFIQSHRDFIFFNQRGTADPGLTCPGSDNLTLDDLKFDRTLDESLAARRALLIACHDRLAKEGVNFDSYSSVATAHDIADLMRVLGYNDYNLFGTSYGPRAILAAVRETPQHIRSVILDSPLAPQANVELDRARDLQRSLREVFDACAAEAKCHAAYPRFEEQYWDNVHRANANPIQVQINDADGNPTSITINGNTLLLGTFAALYNDSVIRVLPFATDAIANGNNGILTLLAQQLVFAFAGDAVAMGTSVNCNEEIPFLTPELQREALKGVRRELVDAGIGDTTQAALDSDLALCAAWGTPKPRPRENEAVVSSIPALVLDGQFDPITPPSYGALAAEKLSRSYRFEFRTSGHGVTYEQYDCASAIIKQFLAQPNNKPNSDCLATIGPLDWVIGDAAPPEPAPPSAEAQPVTQPAPRPPSGITAPDTGTGDATVGIRANRTWLIGLLVLGALLALGGVANLGFAPAMRTARDASPRGRGADATLPPDPRRGADPGRRSRP